jgi:tetratricopeptide (TPR) repeat protein
MGCDGGCFKKHINECVRTGCSCTQQYNDTIRITFIYCCDIKPTSSSYGWICTRTDDGTPNDTYALDNKAAAINNLGNYTGAGLYYNKALAIDRKDTFALTNKAAILHMLGNNTSSTENQVATST